MKNFSALNEQLRLEEIQEISAMQKKTIKVPFCQ